MGTPKRVFVISDLHLGGTNAPMMSHPSDLAEFIESLSDRVEGQEENELVIAGDFVDFLAIEPFRSWTADPKEACLKLEQTMAGAFSEPFSALKYHIRKGHRLTILLGNHDLEMALPQVQSSFCDGIGANLHQVLFVDDGSAYRIGRALIEHGNRYDGANFNDWSGLRAVRSALSRVEEPRTRIRVSAGSQLVERLVNPLKHRSECPYHFLDLLQPEGMLTVFLLLAFEPTLALDLGTIAHVLDSARRRWKTRDGAQPQEAWAVAGDEPEQVDPELMAAFGDQYTQLTQPAQTIGTSHWAQLFKKLQPDSLAVRVHSGLEIEMTRLRQIRVVLERLLFNTSFEWDGDPGPYGKAADRLLMNPATDLVIMGHTHQPRHIAYPGGTYLNTGTWADQVRIPGDVFEEEGSLDRLDNFLRQLILNESDRTFAPAYATFLIDRDGSVGSASLVSPDGSK